MAGIICRHGYSFVCEISFQGIIVCFDTPDSYLYRIIHQALPLYQLAFFTPGRLPSSACILKLYCDITVSPRPSDPFAPHATPLAPADQTYPRHLEVPENTPRLSSNDAPVPDLRRPRVAVHLRELELRLGPHARRQRLVADNVPQRLPTFPQKRSVRLLKTTGRPRAVAASVVAEGGKSSPLRLELLEHRALRVVADDARVDEAAQVELLGPEHRHLGRVSRGCRRLAAWFSDVPLHTTVTAMGKDFGIGRRLFYDAESAYGVTCRLQLTSPLSGIAISGLSAP